MARTKWLTYTQPGSGNSWELSDFIYAPNEHLERNKVSTLTQVKIVDGSYSYVSPEIKFNYEPIVMTFLAIEASDEFTAIINSYIDNQTYVKVVDHLGGEMEGIFTSINEVWISGMEDSYDYQVTFTRIV